MVEKIIKYFIKKYWEAQDLIALENMYNEELLRRKGREWLKEHQEFLKKELEDSVAVKQKDGRD